MSFFDSEVVRAEMVEISELQEELYHSVFKFYSMDRLGKISHIELLEKLLDKQKVLYTRLSLSDDPEGKKMKENIANTASMMGLPSNVDMNVIFSNMTNAIDRMKKYLSEN